MNRPGALFPRQTRHARARAEPIFLITRVSSILLRRYPTGFAAAQQCIFYRTGCISESDSHALPTAGASRMADGKDAVSPC